MTRWSCGIAIPSSPQTVYSAAWQTWRLAIWVRNLYLKPMAEQQSVADNYESGMFAAVSRRMGEKANLRI